MSDDFRITLVDCRQYPGKDPYVKAYYPAESENLVFESSIKKNDPNAKWDEQFLFSCSGSATPMLRLACMDFRGGSDAFVGNLSLDCSKLGTHHLELLRAVITLRVDRCRHPIQEEQSRTGTTISINVREIIVQGAAPEAIVCRGLYAGLTIGEKTLRPNTTTTAVFELEPIGGHVACELMMWNSLSTKETTPFASATIDLRLRKPQRIRCERALHPTTVVVDVDGSSDNEQLSREMLLCCTRLQLANKVASRWMLREVSGVPLSKWLQYPDDYCCTLHNTTEGRLFLAVVATSTSDNSGDEFICGFVTLSLDDTSVTQAHVVLDGSLEGVLELGLSSTQTNEKLLIPQPVRSKLPNVWAPPSTFLERTGRRCFTTLRIVSALLTGIPAAAHPSILHVTCGALFSEQVARQTNVFSLVNRCMQVTTNDASQVFLFSCIGDGGVSHGHLSPYHLESSGRWWVPLLDGLTTTGYVEVTWQSAFLDSPRPTSPSMGESVHLELEIVEAMGLQSADLGGSCDAFCVVQLLPLSENAAHHASTEVVKNTVNPKWNASISTDVCVPQGMVLLVLDNDSGGGEGAFLGMVSIKGDSFVWKNVKGDCWFPLSERESSDAASFDSSAAKGIGSIHLRWKTVPLEQKAPGVKFDEAIREGSCALVLNQFVLENAFALRQDRPRGDKYEVVISTTDDCNQKVVADFDARPYEGDIAFDGEVVLSNRLVQNIANEQQNGRVDVLFRHGELTLGHGTFCINEFSLKASVHRVMLIVDEERVVVPPPQVSFHANFTFHALSKNKIWRKNLHSPSVVNLRLVQMRGSFVDNSEEDGTTVDVLVTKMPFPRDQMHVANKEVRVVKGVDTFIDLSLEVRDERFERPTFPLIHIEVWGVSEARTMLGRCVLDAFCDFERNDGTQWLALESDVDVVGVLEVEYKHSFLTTVVQPDALHPPGSQCLTVEVVQARLLQPVALGGGTASIPSTQVTIGIGTQTFSTRPALPSLHPVFHEGFVFHCPQDGLRDGHVRLQLSDATSLEPVGCALVRTGAFLQLQSHRQWIEVCDSEGAVTGEVLVETLLAVERNVEDEGTVHTHDVAPSMCVSSGSSGGSGGNATLVVIDHASNLVPLQDPTTTTAASRHRDHCRAVVQCVCVAPGAKVIANHTTQPAPDSLNPIWAETLRLPTVPSGSVAQLFVFDSADDKAFLGSAFFPLGQADQPLTELPLLNCSPSGAPCERLAKTISTLGSHATLGSIWVLQRRDPSSALCDGTVVQRCMVVDIVPQSLRPADNVMRKGDPQLTMELTYSSAPGKHAVTSFAVSIAADGLSSTFRPKLRRLSVVNPSVVVGRLIDARDGRELATTSFVVSHNEGADKMDDEIWAQFYVDASDSDRGSVAQQCVGKLYALTNVVASGVDGGSLVEDTVTFRLHDVAGIVADAHPTNPSTMLFRFLSASGVCFHQTRAVRPPTIQQGASRPLQGRSFVVTIPRHHVSNGTVDVQLCVRTCKGSEVAVAAARLVCPTMSSNNFHPDGRVNDENETREEWVGLGPVGEDHLGSSCSLLATGSPGLVQPVGPSIALPMPGGSGEPLGAVRVSRTVHRQWLTGSVMTAVRFMPSSSAGALADERLLQALPRRFDVQLDVQRADKHRVVQTMHCTSRCGTAPFIWQHVTLPPDAVAVEGVRLLAVQSDDSRTLMGAATRTFAWLLSHVQTMEIPLYDGNVPCGFSLVLSNRLNPTMHAKDTNVAASVHLDALRLQLNSGSDRSSSPASLPRVEVLAATLSEPARQTNLSAEGDFASLRGRHLATLVGRATHGYFVFDANQPIQHEASKRQFTHGALLLDVQAQGDGGGVLKGRGILRATTAFSSLTGRQSVDIKSTSGSVIATIDVSYTLNLVHASANHRSTLQRLDQAPPSALCESRRDIDDFRTSLVDFAESTALRVLHPVRAMRLPIFQTADASSGDGSARKVLEDKIMVHLHNRRGDALSTSTSTKQHGSYPEFALLDAQHQPVPVARLTSAQLADRSGIVASVWQLIDADTKQVGFIGRGVVRQHQLAQRLNSTGKADFVVDLEGPPHGNISCGNNSGWNSCGSLQLRLYDALVFDTRVMRCPCVLVHVASLCRGAGVAAKSLPAQLMLVVSPRLRQSDGGGGDGSMSRRFKASSFLLDGDSVASSASKFVSVGPFQILRDVLLDVYLAPHGDNVSHYSPDDDGSGTGVRLSRLSDLFVIDVDHLISAQQGAGNSGRGDLAPLGVEVSLRGGKGDAHEELLRASLRLMVSGEDRHVSRPQPPPADHHHHRHHHQSYIDSSFQQGIAAERGDGRESPLRAQMHHHTRSDVQTKSTTPTGHALATHTTRATLLRTKDVPTMTIGHKAVVWGGRVVSIGGTMDPALIEFSDAPAKTFDSARLRWTINASKISRHRAPPFHREGHAVVRCGDFVVADGGFGPGGLDPSLSAIAGTYEDLHAVYRVAAPPVLGPMKQPNAAGETRASPRAASPSSTGGRGGVTGNNTTTTTSHQNTTTTTNGGYLDSTWVLDMKRNEWQPLRTRGAAKSPRSDHTLVLLDSTVLLAFGGFTVTIVERVTELSTASNDTHKAPLLQPDSDASASPSTAEKQPPAEASDGVSDHRGHGAGLLKRRQPKKLRTYQAVESLCNDLRCFNLETFEWNALNSTMDASVHGQSSIPIGDSSGGGGGGSSRLDNVSRPPPTAAHTAEFDAQSRIMYVFGGLTSTCTASVVDEASIALSAADRESVLDATPSDAMYLLFADDLRWFRLRRLEYHREWPSPRYGHASAMVPGGALGGATRSMLIFGGDGDMPLEEKLWRFNVVDNTFERILLHPSIPLTPRFRASMSFVRTHSDEEGGLLVINGGSLPVSVGVPSRDQSSTMDRSCRGQRMLLPCGLVAHAVVLVVGV